MLCLQRGSGLIATTVPTGISMQSLYVLPVSVWVFSRCTGFLPQPINMHWFDWRKWV